MSDDWRVKPDLDLDADDLDAMLREGEPILVNQRPELPGWGFVVHASHNYGSFDSSLTPGGAPGLLAPDTELQTA